MAYRVVLIDDEPWTIIYYKKVFNWQELGFEVIAEIQNSAEALDIIVRTEPDVVFTDIRMPRMSGIELMQRVREGGINSEFVIVSGFAEFSYAQEAIKLGAFEYCLKPVSADKANEILRRLLKQLNAKKAEIADGGLKEYKEAMMPDLSVKEEANLNFEKLLEYMRVNLHKKLQLKELAKEFYLHPNYCCHLFVKMLGSTFSEYLTDLRMKEAEKLMAQKNFTVNEVARKAGYDDYFYFNKVFKKYHGVTPSEYRKRKNKV